MMDGGEVMNYFLKGWVAPVCISCALLVSCSKAGEANKHFIAQYEKPAVSPSGKYQLKVLKGNDGRSAFQRFEIYEINHRDDISLLYSCQDQYYLRFRTVFLWDNFDRVWVYSGDVGTFFWQQKDDGSWEKHSFADESIELPELLKSIKRNSR